MHFHTSQWWEFLPPTVISYFKNCSEVSLTYLQLFSLHGFSLISLLLLWAPPDANASTVRQINLNYLLNLCPLEAFCIHLKCNIIFKIPHSLSSCQTQDNAVPALLLCHLTFISHRKQIEFRAFHTKVPTKTHSEFSTAQGLLVEITSISLPKLWLYMWNQLL